LLSAPPLPTFRDPAGSLELRADGAYRQVRSPFEGELLALLELPFFQRIVASGRLVASEVVSRPSDSEALLLRHPLIFFPSYPWEWPPSMWQAAAELTLNLCRELLQEGWILKDATPLNVLFQGTDAIFVDILSIQRADLGQPIWNAYGQFIRTFVLPLLAHTQLGWPLQSTFTRRDGYEPEEIFAALPWYSCLRQPALTTVTLPMLLSKLKRDGKTGQQTRLFEDPDLVRDVLLHSIGGLRKRITRTRSAFKASHWSGYVDNSAHYSPADHASKRSFVTRALAAAQSRRVLDIGCNTGAYSLVAADAGAQVVAIDSDPQTVERLCQSLKGQGKNVLPLCIDLANPTPASGWSNAESTSFLSRCAGRFDTVMMLAMIHHLLIGSQIPLDHIATLCRSLTTDHLILEWVPPTDEKYREIVRGREAIYEHITEAAFRAAFAAFFITTEELTLENGRILFHLRKRYR